MYDLSPQHGFSIMKVLVSIASVVIIAAIAILIFNPGQKLEEQRNTQRLSDITTILHAVDVYTRAHNNIFPSSITSTQMEICRYNAKDCVGLVDLSVLTPYAIVLPHDPTGGSEKSTGYTIVKTSDGHITISAPHAEHGAVVQVTW